MGTARKISPKTNTGKVFFDIGLSLDGYMAGENRGPDNPLGDRGTEIHNWLFKPYAFRHTHGVEQGERTIRTTGWWNRYLPVPAPISWASVCFAQPVYAAGTEEGP